MIPAVWGPDRVVDATRSAVISGILGIVGTAIFALSVWHPSPAFRLAQVAGFVLNGTVLAILWFRRARPSAALAYTLFMLTVLPALVLVWLANEASATRSPRWIPYEPDKLSVMALAMIAPPGWWPGIIAIGAFLAAALIHHQTMSDTLRLQMMAVEPVAIIAYCLFAFVLLTFRQHGRRLQAELARARSEKLVLESVARFAMSLRDLANSPVQTLELIRHALPVGDPRLRGLERHMGHALDRLRQLNQILVRYQRAITWKDSGTSSFDAIVQAEEFLNTERGTDYSARRSSSK
jgi:hypothetical protein